MSAKTTEQYDEQLGKCRDIYLKKTKILRIKQIEDNKGKTLISEGLDAGYQDIINYSLFALIRINE